MIDASWIIQERATGKAIAETFDFELVQFVRLDRFKVWTAREWLESLNRSQTKEPTG